MWYESKMINETLNSLQAAIRNSTIPVDVMVCLNSQTYLEIPSDENATPKIYFNDFINHPILSTATIIDKTDAEPFYNIADWRRDIYGDEFDYKYIVWGESDSLVPEDYFNLLDNINLNQPHIISLATRKMWDQTWDEVEHPWIHKFPRNGIPPARLEQAPEPYNCGDYISIEQLNSFNSQFDPILVKLNRLKVDGNMTALSKGIPYPFLPVDLHFINEDLCFQLFLEKKNIPQYHISTRLKGHNTMHPMKRLKTKSSRSDSIYLQYKQDTYKIINEFITNI